MSDERRVAGFKERTGVETARARFLDCVDPIDRSTTVVTDEADGRILANTVTAQRPVPHYTRAAMDGYAVRATDTFGATARSPVRLGAGEKVRPETAVRVHTGSELPDDADAVVPIEDVEATSGELEITTAVVEGANVSPVGEDVAVGATLFESGHRLQPADLALLSGAGRETVSVFARPRIEVIPTGDELVRSDPRPGEVVETNGLMVARYIERWGGEATYRDVVPDDRSALRSAIEQGLDADAVVTTGGSSVGERDLVPDIVDELGALHVHGIAIQPGHPAALGIVGGTPVAVLPGFPVACLVTAVQFLRPAVYRLGNAQAPAFPTTGARLRRKVASEPGVRTYVRVRLEHSEDEVEAVPIRAGGAGVLSSVTRADGWVVVPESSEGLDSGAEVAVQQWEGPS